jgi:hypothetical protein
MKLSCVSIKLEDNYLHQNKIDAISSELDPLGVDRLFAILPEINDMNRTYILIDYSIQLAKKAMRLQSPSQASAYSCLRDLGMLASCLTKEGIKLNSIPLLEDALVYLSRYAGEVPRDTFFSYSSRNPSGERMRRYTGRTEEVIFINSLKEGMQNLHKSINNLHISTSLSISDPDFATFINQATYAFQAMEKAIMKVKKDIPPEVFTFHIRPYFEPYEVKGVKYTAAGASSMPINLIDKLLWADRVESQIYRDYYEHSLLYLPFSYRQFEKTISSTPSIITKIYSEIKGKELNYHLVNSIKATINLLSAILKFRCPHKRVVDDNFKLRSNESVGSGGYKPDFLDFLIQKNFQTFKQLKAILGEVGADS